MRTLVIWLLLVTVNAAHAAGTATDIEGSVQQFCVSCHGPDGVSRYADVPNISGLPEVVIANALYDYRGHTRPCRVSSCAADDACPSATMCDISDKMSDELIAAYAAYYAARPFAAAANEFDAAMAAEGRKIHMARCESCHSRGGSDPADEASLLRGQNKAYLANAVADYVKGRRLPEDSMTKSMTDLDEREVAALVEFYASPAD